MSYNLLGKKVRGRFGFPSGEIATTLDTARLMLQEISQLGFYEGKSTTIQPRAGNPEDIISQPTPTSLWNAVGYTNPGLEATVDGFVELRKEVPDDVFLMPQIGEGDANGFSYCAERFDQIRDSIDGLSLNISCPHASKGGILIGSDPGLVYEIVSAARKKTKLPLGVKINAGVALLEDVVKAAEAAGANFISGINTLGGVNPELSNGFGGLSGREIFQVTLSTVQRLRKITNLPIIVMGGISDANDVRRLDLVDSSFYYAIGTALAGMDLEGKKLFFEQLERDLRAGTNITMAMALNRNLMEYKPFVVRDVVELSDGLRLIRFYQNVEAGPGQFVFIKLDGKHAKPFSVADDLDGLEIVVRKVGETTSKMFELKRNNVVRVRGPYGKKYSAVNGVHTIYVGAGCGIAPIYHAVQHHRGPKMVFIGAKTAKELVYLDRFMMSSTVVCSTDDGSEGYKGNIAQLLDFYMRQIPKKDPYFFNCGPEVMLKAVDEIERRYTSPDRITHLVERMTSCGISICGKCSIPSGHLACSDGPFFDAVTFRPGEYTRDKTGAKVYFK